MICSDMTALATPDITPAPDGPREDRARLDGEHRDRQRARLGRLADLGLQIAEGLAAQARGTGPQVVEGDLALAFDRVARAVRMAVALEARLSAEARPPAEDAPGADPTGPAQARKDRVARIVKRVAEDQEGLDGFQVDWAARQARERLEHDDIYGQVMTRPVSDLVADICRDLGLTPEWARLAEEAWAQDEINGGEVGEALRDHLDGADPSGSGEGPPAAPIRIPTFGQRLQAAAREAQAVLAARRESG